MSATRYRWPDGQYVIVFQLVRNVAIGLGLINTINQNEMRGLTRYLELIDDVVQRGIIRYLNGDSILDRTCRQQILQGCIELERDFHG